MAHYETLLSVMEALKIADKHIIGEIMAEKGIWTAGTSAINNSYKILKNSDLERGDGWFRVKGCKSEYKEHAKLLTKDLAKIIKLNINYKILREPTLKDIALRPDALVLLTKETKAVCFILEVCNNETPEYLTQKVNTWKVWTEAKETLSNMFGLHIPCFDIVVDGEHTEGTFEFNHYIAEVKK